MLARLIRFESIFADASLILRGAYFPCLGHRAIELPMKAGLAPARYIDYAALPTLKICFSFTAIAHFAI